MISPLSDGGQKSRDWFRDFSEIHIIGFQAAQLLQQDHAFCPVAIEQRLSRLKLAN